MTGQSARAVAWEALRRIDHEGAYANLLVPQLLTRSDLSRRDRAFVTELVYGATRMRTACDALVDRFVVSEPRQEIRSLLRLGTYQLSFTATAPHAAVAETVGLAPRSARGFVNAVLRRVAAAPNMTWPDDAARLSYPRWIYDRLCLELGEDAHAAMTRMNEAPPVTDRGDGYTQDLSSQWVAACVGAVSGERVLDMCAAPGGKATALASCGAYVVAADKSIGRAGLMHRNVRTLGADVGIAVADGTSSPWAPDSFDRVLLDAPCSGLGALRRRPDARWRIEATDIDDLAALQRSLLVEAARAVRPGGTLVYSVCTVTAAESTDHPIPDGFDVISTPPRAGTWRAFGHGWRVLPHDANTDGMTLIILRRDPSAISTTGERCALG